MVLMKAAEWSPNGWLAYDPERRRSAQRDRDSAMTREECVEP